MGKGLNPLLKEMLSVTSKALGVPWSELARQTGVNDFLIETSEVTCPREFCAKALAHLPIGAGDLCGAAVAAAVIMFLDRVIGPPAPNYFERRVLDARNMVRSGGDEAACRSLIDTMYR